MATLVVRLARHALIAGLFLLAAALGTASGVLFAFSGDLPGISALDTYTPATITRVYGLDDRLVGDFATQRRTMVRYEDIPDRLRLAILAAEDADFERHFGLSISRIAVTAVRDLTRISNPAGASTLTQQLARKLFLTDEKTWERKIKEALLSIQIEKRYTKREIFTLYCNQIYWGHGAYGVEAASQLYFRKSVKDLTLEEAALIAGIIQGNVRQSPYVNMSAALRRRNYTLNRMADEGFITREEAEAARKAPIVVRGEPGAAPSVSPYYLEEVRKHLEARYGAKQLYEAGLTVRTSLDVRLQAAANAALARGLRRLDKIRGFRTPARNVMQEQQPLDKFQHPRWNRPVQVGDIVPALVTAVDRGRIRVRVGRSVGVIDRDGYKWAGRTAERLVRAGDLIELAVTAVDEKTGALIGTLEQPPLIEGAVLAIDNRTGQIRAMIGGYDFERSKFNRAVQALRQVGSSFKPFVYAAAIDRGHTAVSIIQDELQAFPAGPNQPPYEPRNYDRNYEGPVTLRHALEQSRNLPAVKLMSELGPESVTSYARRFGFDSLPPYLSVALGSSEATLLTMVRAYSVFPNQGVMMEPFGVLRVTDREGTVLEENRPRARDAIRADTAFVMTNLLRGVVLRGTAAKAAALNWPLAGKTGTTDDYTDAWFIGFDPDLTLGVWVGYDQKKSIGSNMTGGDAALPIWIDIMKAYIDDRPASTGFEPPGNIIFVTVDRQTGELTQDGAPNAISEAFMAGTQPGVGFPRN